MQAKWILRSSHLNEDGTITRDSFKGDDLQQSLDMAEEICDWEHTLTVRIYTPQGQLFDTHEGRARFATR